MSSRTGPLGLLAALLPFFCVAATAAPATEREWRFQVSLGDKPIGYHDFRLSRDGAATHVETEASFDVSFWVFNAYRYSHRNSERWKGDCLTSLDATTDDNGERFEVRGEEAGGRFVVDTGAASKTLPSCVMSFAYWNEQFLQQDRLLNPQTGEYLPVSVTAKGHEPIVVEGRTEPSSRYTITARDFTIDVWYGPDGRWLALDSTTEDGHTLHYRLR